MSLNVSLKSHWMSWYHKVTEGTKISAGRGSQRKMMAEPWHMSKLAFGNLPHHLPLFNESERENNFASILGSWLRHRVTREKQISLCMCVWAPPQWYRIQDMTRVESFYMKKQYIWRIDKARGFGLGIVNSEKITRFIYTTFQALNSL